MKKKEVIKNGVITKIKEYLHANITSSNSSYFFQLFISLSSGDSDYSLCKLNDFLGENNKIDLNQILSKDEQALYNNRLSESKLFLLNRFIKTNVYSQVQNLDKNKKIQSELNQIKQSPRLYSIVLNKLAKWDKIINKGICIKN